MAKLWQICQLPHVRWRAVTYWVTPLFTPALWPNTLGETIICWSPAPEQGEPILQVNGPTRTTSRGFLFVLSFQTGGSWPWSGTGDNLRLQPWKFPRQLRHCPGEVQQKVWWCAHEIRFFFDLCLPRCKEQWKKCPLSHSCFFFFFCLWINICKLLRAPWLMVLQTTQLDSAVTNWKEPCWARDLVL